VTRGRLPQTAASPGLIGSRVDWLIEHGFTSAPTQYRLYGMTQPTVIGSRAAATEPPRTSCQSTDQLMWFCTSHWTWTKSTTAAHATAAIASSSANELWGAPCTKRLHVQLAFVAPVWSCRRTDSRQTTNQPLNYWGLSKQAMSVYIAHYDSDVSDLLLALWRPLLPYGYS